MELIFSYIAGLLTLINPCVLPVLPIVIAASLQAGRFGPLAIAGGMSLSFVIFGMLVSTVGQSIGLTERVLSQIGSILMIFFGVILLVPKLNERFALLASKLTNSADKKFHHLSSVENSSNIKSQFLGGTLLGVVWSPCIGPTLGGAISLASQGKDLFWVFCIMLFFALGVSTIILVLGYGTKEAIGKREETFERLAKKAKPIMGITFLIVGLMIFFKIHYLIEAWLLAVLPEWLIDLSVKF